MGADLASGHPFRRCLHPGSKCTLDSSQPLTMDHPRLHLWKLPRVTPPPRPSLLGLRRPRPTFVVLWLGARGAGSYRADGCPHDHLPTWPRQLCIRPCLPAAAWGSVVALFPPYSAAHIRLSGTGAWESLKTAAPVPALAPPQEL